METKSVHFRGVGIAGYRSFGSDVQLIGPLAKTNLIAGGNNSGKSNILRFVAECLPAFIEKLARFEPQGHSGLDVPQGLSTSSVRLSIPVPNDDQYIFALADEITKHSNPAPKYEAKTALEAVLRSPSFHKFHGCTWIEVDPSQSNRDNIGVKLTPDTPRQGDQPALNVIHGVRHRDWKLLFELTSGMHGGDTRNWIPRVINWLVSHHLPRVPVVFVPAVREIDAGDSDVASLGGRGLVHKLSKLQNPLIAELGKRKAFLAIQDFVRAVTQCDDALLEVPYDRQTVHVHMRGRVLPLSHLGTGIHQVVMLAAAATLHDSHLVCLEEPEMNLHPTLQKYLIRYLARNTSNQYLISTHSAHLLDTEGAAVFHVDCPEGWSRVRFAKEPDDHLSICKDLGYHASDLLQANSVVWVEGPSDRLYLLNWIRGAAPDLIEGLHFSVMFYGGKLLTFLTGDDALSEQFIELRKLNRNFAVIMDSDLGKATGVVARAKRRIQEELRTSSGLAWITSGREIENYLPRDRWNAAMNSIHPRSGVHWNGGRYSRVFRGIPSADKIRLARAMCDAGSLSLDRLDLREQIEALVRFIRAANPKLSLEATKS
jgi:predicted ATPase